MKNPINKNFTCRGINSAIALLDSNRYDILRIDILRGGRAEKNPRIKALTSNHLVYKLEKDQFYKKYNGSRDQGIAVEFYGDLFNTKIPDFNHKSSACLLALDQVEDPQNFGQIIRTAECAGLDGIIFPQHNSVPITQTVIQVSQGAFVNMPLYQITNLSQSLIDLKENEFWIVGLENSINAKQWHEIDYSGKIIIVVGSEGKGLRKKKKKKCDFQATIPMKGSINSLNVSAAVSAILFERQRQLNKD